MSDLTISFLQEIEAELKGDYFLIEDFDIKTESYSESVILHIQYIYMPQYKFKGVIYKDKERYIAEFSPGNITFTVRRDNLDKDSFLNIINKWVNNTFIEMSKTPIARQVKNHEEILKSFQEKIHSMGDEGTQFFSKEEGEELRNKLNELEELLKGSVIEKNEDKKAQEQELEKLNSEINTLKKHLEILNRKNWFLSFSTRLYIWFKNNPNLTRQLAGFSREMLPQEAKDIVSQEALDQLLLPPGSSEISSDAEKII